ncbi:hypothetical protein I4U23_019707 [Adineta vaga]|nr:hypothetical protein I4U23_019707 [Adineta vaga]
MAALNTSGMGTKTSIQYHNVANKMIKYINNPHRYEEPDLVGDYWYDYERQDPMRNGFNYLHFAHTPKHHHTHFGLYSSPSHEYRVLRKVYY